MAFPQPYPVMVWIEAMGIARRGVESSARLGRHRWVVERTSPGWPGSAA